jgi:hypothetical protein
VRGCRGCVFAIEISRSVDGCGRGFYDSERFGMIGLYTFYHLKRPFIITVIIIINHIKVIPII